MKKLTLLLAVSIPLVTALPAQVQDYIVTPSSLADWQVNGADPATLQAQSILSLPAGAELARTFSNGAVILYTQSSPHFGAVSADWPIVQVGPAALALVQKGVIGEVVLLVGNTVTPLPIEVPLDSNGNTMQPLELVLGYDPIAKVGLVTFGDQALSFNSPTNSSSVNVAMTAGEKTPWAQDSLEVLVMGPDDGIDPSGSKTTSADAAKQSAMLKSAAEKLREARGMIGGTPGSGTAAGKTTIAKAGGGLEIYTPGAVRHHAAVVRTTIAQSLKK